MTKPPISTKARAKSDSRPGSRRCATRLRPVVRRETGCGVKNCEPGTMRQNAIANARDTSAAISSAHCQDTKSTAKPGMSRPTRPPIVVPAT
ncbi:Uncharacterised protein [Mycobacteroides abscessus subsp. abscessus]|nr:Uncharacterised protein [Mycobacteroides abscessus subsp. abscessus]